MEQVRVYELPAGKMVSSGTAMFGDGVLERFGEWFSGFPITAFPRDFLWFDGTGFVWYYTYEEGMQVPDDFQIVDFSGGFYAVATGKDGDEADCAAAKTAIDRFIEDSDCFERDYDRVELGNIITSPAVAEALGYYQMDYYTPIRRREARG